MKQIRNKETGDIYDYMGYKYIAKRVRGTDTDIVFKEVYAYCPEQDHSFTIKAKDWKNYEYIK